MAWSIGSLGPIVRVGMLLAVMLLVLLPELIRQCLTRIGRQQTGAAVMATVRPARAGNVPSPAVLASVALEPSQAAPLNGTAMAEINGVLEYA